MANYPCDPIPHLPPGAGYVPFNHRRPQRGYVVVGGSTNEVCDDWAIVQLEPEPSWEQFEGTSILIRAQMAQRGYDIRQISRCAMGAASDLRGLLIVIAPLGTVHTLLGIQ